MGTKILWARGFGVAAEFAADGRKGPLVHFIEETEVAREVSAK
jgi:hypothetical protein